MADGDAARSADAAAMRPMAPASSAGGAMRGPDSLAPIDDA